MSDQNPQQVTADAAAKMAEEIRKANDADGKKNAQRLLYARDNIANGILCEVLRANGANDLSEEVVQDAMIDVAFKLADKFVARMHRTE